MSELLQNWLNNEVGLSTNITNFEKDFSNGYLFGEILNKFRQQDDFDMFLNKSAHEAKIANFKLLEPTLKALGIKFNATQSNGIMNAERGSSLRLLYQLKMASEKLALAADSAGTKGSGVTKGMRVARDTFDDHERRFFEHRLRATCVNVKQVRLEKVTKKFVQHRQMAEAMAIEGDAEDKLRLQDTQDVHRHNTLMRLRQNKWIKEEETRRGIEQWDINMQVKSMREGQEMHFANRVMTKRLDRDTSVRQAATAEVRDGVDSFESGLLNLGLVSHREVARTTRLDEDSDDEGSDRSDLQPERLMAATTHATSGAELTQALEARMPSAHELEQEAGLFLRRNKESKRAGSVARKERERRRRRVLVEQQREQTLVEESALEDVLLEKLNREPLEEQAIGYSAWRTKRYEDVIVSNRQLRQQDYASRAKSAQQEALKQDKTLLEESLEDMQAQGERERARYRAVERGRQSKLRAQLSEECEGILELVAGLAEAALHQEQLTDKSEVDETLWREWMAMFVASAPVPAPGPLASEPADIYPLTAEPPESDNAILEDAALRDYTEARGQWEPRAPVPEAVSAEGDQSAQEGGAAEAGAAQAGAAGGGATAPAPFDAAAEVRAALEVEAATLSFASRLSSEVDFVGSRPVNYRLGVVVASLLDRRHPLPPQPDPPPVPDVPLKLVLTGKPFAGKKLIAGRIAQSYNLQVVDVDEVVRECLALSRRPDIGSTEPIDMLSFSMDAADEKCKQCEENGNPYVRRLQKLGYEVQDLLDAGESISDELYVDMVTTKIRSLFPDRLPKPKPALTDSKAAAEEAEASADAAALEPTEEGDDEKEEKEEEDEEAAKDCAEGSATNADVTRLAPTPTPLAVEEPAAAGGSPGSGTPGETCGWVLVGYPEGAEQLGLLERFLSGWVEPSCRPTPEAEVRKAEAALLAPRPPEEPPPFALTPGGCDLHFRLDVSGDEAVRRAVGRRLDPQTSLTYHLEDSPPATKRQLINERLLPVDELADSIGTLTQRIHLFDLAQGGLDTSLSHFGPLPDVQRLVCVDANRSLDEVYDSVEEQVAMLLERKHAEATASAEPAAGGGAGAAAAAPPLSATPPPETPPAEAGSAAPAAQAEEPPPPSVEPLTLAELPQSVEKLEEPSFQLLLKQWDELQAGFVGSVRELSSWHRAHAADFRSGLHRVKECFVSFLQRPDDRQAHVDAFIATFNSFSEEYPSMRKQDETKNELHQRADDLGDALRALTEERRNESVQQLEVLQKGWWVESEVETVAAQVQYAVQMEAARYHAACQLLTDFYYSAMNLGLPAPREPLAQIDVLSLEDKSAEAAPEPKKKGKEAPKGKKGKDQPQEEAVPDLTPEEKAALRLRRFVDGGKDPESGAALPGRWEFPFLPELMAKGNAVVWQLAEYGPPATAEKAEPDGADDKKGKKAKEKKGRTTPEPGKKGKNASKEAQEEAPPAPAPRLYVDLQNALLAERTTYLHRLSVIRDWAERRLLHMTEVSTDMFSVFRDWVVLRRQAELDAIDGLTDAIKDTIEREELIISRLALEGAHAHHHPNLRLRPPPEPPEPLVGFEPAAPHRWTVSQLDGLLDAVADAASSVTPGGRTLPLQPLLALLAGLARPGGAQAPTAWCQGMEKLQALCGLFNHPPYGTVDCVELLLAVGLAHSAVGWPSLETLLEVRRALEGLAPANAAWPDFWVTGEDVAGISALLDDADGAEAAHAAAFRAETGLEPLAFDRSGAQLRWVARVLQRFPAPLRQRQAWELEAAWHDHAERGAQEAKLEAQLLEDHVELDVQQSPSQEEFPDMPGAETPSEAPSRLDTAPPPQSVEPPEPPKERPAEPLGLPERPPGAVSVRQLLSYLCQGPTADEGLARAVAVLGPCAGGGAAAAADLHACLLQFGARPTPPSAASDARPWLPSLGQFCEELGVASPEAPLKLEELTASPQFQRLMGRGGIGLRHRRAHVEKLFPRVAAERPRSTAARSSAP